MAWRLADFVVRGEILNTSKNSVHGCIHLEGHEAPVMIELTGNCDPDLAGWHFRFEARPRSDGKPADPPPDLSNFAWHQIGPTGTMTAARQVKVFDCSAREFVIRCELNEPPPTRWVRCLYLEWYSQNGRVVIELPDPILEFVERVPLPGVPMSNGKSDDAQPPDAPGAGAPALSVTLIKPKDEGGAEIHHQLWASPDAVDEAERAHDDEFGLVPQELQRLLDAQAAETDRAAGTEDEASKDVREMELMDDQIENGEKAPICSLFEEPMQLPAADTLDDKQAERMLKSLLAQLALCGVALHICEHYTPREAYRFLVEKFLLKERFFPQLRGTQWVQNYMTSEYCAICEAEAERDYQENKDRGDSGN
jgi:hypothetical protein